MPRVITQAAMLLGLVFFCLDFQTPASAAVVEGWCFAPSAGVTECRPSPTAACKAMFETYGGIFFLGFTDQPRWDRKHCRWFGGNVNPTSVEFKCLSGQKAPPGRCVDVGEEYQGRDDCSNNNGGNLNPSTENPIEILSGAKIFDVEDYRNADGSLFLTRHFRSITNGGSQYLRRTPLGFANWSLAMFGELQIASDFHVSGVVEFQDGNGNTYRFIRQTDGTMVPHTNFLYPLPQTDYSLEFVGTWPSDLATITSMQTVWRVRDKDDRLWIFRSYSDLQQGFGIAHPTGSFFAVGLNGHSSTAPTTS